MSSEYRGPSLGHELNSSESQGGLMNTLRELIPWLVGILAIAVAVVALSWWVILPRWPLIQARWPEVVSLVTRIVRPDVVSTPTRLAVQVVNTATPTPIPPTKVPLPTPTSTTRPTDTPAATATSSATMTVTVTGTASPSPTTSPTTTSTPLTITVGGYVEVFDTDGDGLNVRSEPDTSSDKLGKFPDGAVLLVNDGPVEADGYQWWQVEDEDDLVGWCAADWLKPTTKPESD